MVVSREESYPFVPFRRLIAKRLVGTGETLPKALLAVARTLGNWQPATPLCYAGDPPRPIELSESTLSAYLTEVQKSWLQGIPEIFRLSTHIDEPQLALFFDIEPNPICDVEYLWFSLPILVSEKKLELASLIDLMSDICADFNAYHSYIEDEQLLLLYQSASSFELDFANLPPNLHQFFPGSPIADKAPDSLYPLLIPQEFNSRYIPHAIWWINFWDRIQVEAVGQNRIRAATWADVIEQPDGSLILVTTEEPIDITKSEHIVQLNQIIDCLNLRELQENHRYELD